MISAAGLNGSPCHTKCRLNGVPATTVDGVDTKQEQNLAGWDSVCHDVIP